MKPILPGTPEHAATLAQIKRVVAITTAHLHTPYTPEEKAAAEAHLERVNSPGVRQAELNI